MSLNVTWAKILGIVLVLVGLLGFFSDGTVLGMFHVNMFHNVVHLLSGVIGLWAGFSNRGVHSKRFNVIFGIVYLIVAIVGFANIMFFTDLLMLNAADNWLHLVIGVVTTAIGLWA
jgi:hypothetical protein